MNCRLAKETGMRENKTYHCWTSFSVTAEKDGRKSVLLITRAAAWEITEQTECTVHKIYIKCYSKQYTVNMFLTPKHLKLLFYIYGKSLCVLVLYCMQRHSKPDNTANYWVREKVEVSAFRLESCQLCNWIATDTSHFSLTRVSYFGLDHNSYK